MLKGEVYKAVLSAHLDPYLGYLHSIQFSKPSMVCDLQEIYRCFIDDFVIQYCQDLKRRDFTIKRESVSRKKKGKREYLNDADTRRMMKELRDYFEMKIDVPLMRHGKTQRVARANTYKLCELWFC